MEDAVHVADWLTFAAGLSRRSVDLLYADPPFNTGRMHTTPPGSVRVGRPVEASFGDRFGDTDDFIRWLRERLEATLPALAPAAAVLIHVDWRTSHRVRILLDDLLGEHAFVNHLVWQYGLGGSSPRRFARKHDDILYYSLDPDRAYFDPPLVPATSNRLRGKLKKATDVIDVPSLNNMSSERTGYPTQKPLALLELLISACCRPGGLVLDPCCGSGTTLVASGRTGRRWTGCDISERAVEIANSRLKGEFTAGRIARIRG